MPVLIRNRCKRDFFFHPIHVIDAPKPKLERLRLGPHGAGRAKGTCRYFIKRRSPKVARGLIDERNQRLAVSPEFVPKPRGEYEPVYSAPDDDYVV